MLTLTGPGTAQIILSPRLNAPLPVGSVHKYGSPRLGYGAELEYAVSSHWKVAAAYDQYRFRLKAPLRNLDLDSAAIALLNLPETITLELSSGSWSTGIRYQESFSRFSSYAGVEVSTNRVVARGYGVRIIRRYWGLAPVVGARWMITPRWGLHGAGRLQTIFTRNDIPFVNEVIDRYLAFISVHLGVTVKLSLKSTRK